MRIAQGGATRVCEVPAAVAPPPLPGATFAPLRDSTGAWLSSGTLEHAASAVTAIAARR